ncbi:AAA family ATPase [Actinoplanes sp. NPDC051346]|uniref:AAA family ATPase n=1 Tax=Actinoplanes sp. NPDC051346 TaxID=3155048 RepID=UPI00342646CE
MDNSEMPVARSLAERLRLARARAFVGRNDELAAFEAALRGDPTAAPVLYVHGPGGIGKSTLVRQLCDQVRHAGRPLIEIDGRFVGRSPAEFEHTAQPVLDRRDAVLVVDSFEHCQWLEAWLWQQFLPRIADGALVVLAGRQTPMTAWTSDPGWADVLRVFELGPLSEEQARRLLTVNGVNADNQEALVRLAGGNPLALSLAAAVDSAHPGAALNWSSSAETLRTLIAGLIGEVPSSTHRRALEVAAQAHTTTEELLHAALPDEDAQTLFAWLRGLPFMETTPRGIYPHDAAREAVVADLRWRAPQAFLAMKRKLTAEYLRVLREAPTDQMADLTRKIFYLFREVKAIAKNQVWDRDGEVHDDPLRPEDVETIVAMAADVEGPESAELVRYWIGRQPEAFSVFRLISTGRTVAFSTRLALPFPPDAQDIATDPVVAAAWEFCMSTAPARPGEHIGMTRFCVYPEAHEVPSPVTNLNQSRAHAEVARVGSGRAYGMLVFHDHEAWAERLRGVMTDAGVRPTVGDRTYALFVNDWRQVPFETWIDHIINETDVPAPAAPSGTTRTAFDQAVRDALQHWRSPRAFAVVDLLKTRLVADSTDAVADLRALIEQAVGEVGHHTKTVKAHEALVATFFSGAPTQEAAARRAGMAFSTYRRHLRQGLDQVCASLWDIELHGTGPRVNRTEQR